MFVAETLSGWFPVGEKEEKLTFDYDAADPLLEELRAISAEEEEEPLLRNRDRNVMERAINEEQTSAASVLLCDEEEASSSQHPPGLYYIRESLEALKDEENCVVFREAIRTLPLLIAKESIGFDDVAEELFDMLVSLDGRFGMDDFTVRTLLLILC